MQKVNDQVNAGTEHSSSERVESQDALEQCPHCGKFVPNVYRHTSRDDCDVINEQISRLIAEGVSDDFRP